MMTGFLGEEQTMGDKINFGGGGHRGRAVKRLLKYCWWRRGCLDPWTAAWMAVIGGGVVFLANFKGSAKRTVHEFFLSSKL